MEGKNLLEKTSATYNEYYGTYRAAYCHSTGLPMYGSKDFAEVQEKGFYTKTRAKREKVQIDESQPVGWYRMPNGYTPLFRAEQQGDKKMYAYPCYECEDCDKFLEAGKTMSFSEFCKSHCENCPDCVVLDVPYDEMEKSK